ncbi:DNA polymerase III subunit gamma/tau [Trichinella spiralis]|uniref:DNA polymerase III subunit gamma/tau n=1 Tax=Trichinella spiralis TaxID=6334 RepID=A0ABR3KPP0_TRISP
MSRQSVRVPIWLTTPSDTNPYALPKVANARLVMVSQLWSDWSSVIPHLAQQEKSSDYAASKDNSIFRRLADYCGGQRPFSSSLTIARQLRAKVFGSGQRKISTRTQFVPCSCSADPSFDGRSVSLATFCTPTLRNLTLGYEHGNTAFIMMNRPISASAACVQIDRANLLFKFPPPTILNAC